MKKRKRRSPLEWQALIRTQLESQLSLVDFCRQQDLDTQYFGKRKRIWQAGQSKLSTSQFIKMEFWGHET